jgi:hypothetical protein
MEVGMELKFKRDVKYSGGYNTKVRSKTVPLRDLIRGFKYSIKNGDDYESVESELNGFISAKVTAFSNIMLMDIDYTDFMNEAVEVLENEGIAHTLIESSPNRYWIIVDVFTHTKRSMARKLTEFSMVDPRYIDYVKRRGAILRAYPKNAFKPTVISSYGDGSTLYNEYVEAFIEYWQLPHIEWILNDQLMNNL